MFVNAKYDTFALTLTLFFRVFLDNIHQCVFLCIYICSATYFTIVKAIYKQITGLTVPFSLNSKHTLAFPTFIFVLFVRRFLINACKLHVALTFISSRVPSLFLLLQIAPSFSGTSNTSHKKTIVLCASTSNTITASSSNGVPIRKRSSSTNATKVPLRCTKLRKRKMACWDRPQKH